jgi:hypothetical protein
MAIAGTISWQTPFVRRNPANFTVTSELETRPGIASFDRTVANMPHFAINLPQRISGMALQVVNAMLTATAIRSNDAWTLKTL